MHNVLNGFLNSLVYFCAMFNFWDMIYFVFTFVNRNAFRTNSDFILWGSAPLCPWYLRRAKPLAGTAPLDPACFRIETLT